MMIYDVFIQVTRDPRFDDLSGDYREELFSRSYGFLDDIKHREREVRNGLNDKKRENFKQTFGFCSFTMHASFENKMNTLNYLSLSFPCFQKVEKSVKKEKNPEKKKELQFLLNRMVCLYVKMVITQ